MSAVTAERADAAQAPRYRAGQRVRVRKVDAPGHIRTPHYIRGRTGTIVRPLGVFANPEDLAFARPAPKRNLYHVLFEQEPIWHEGRPGDTVMVEVFEHWLEEA